MNNTQPEQGDQLNNGVHCYVPTNGNSHTPSDKEKKMRKLLECLYARILSNWDDVQRTLQESLLEKLINHMLSMVQARKQEPCFISQDNPFNNHLIVSMVLMGINISDHETFFHSLSQQSKARGFLTVDRPDHIQILKKLKTILKRTAGIRTSATSSITDCMQDLSMHMKLSDSKPAPLMFIIRRAEQFHDLNNFLLSVSRYCTHIAICIVIGAATSLKRILGAEVMSRVTMDVFRYGSPSDYLNEFLVKLVIKDTQFPIRFSAAALNWLRQFYLGFNFSVKAIINQIKFLVCDHVLGLNTASVDLLFKLTKSELKVTSLKGRDRQIATYLRDLPDVLQEIMYATGFQSHLLELMTNILEDPGFARKIKKRQTIADTDHINPLHKSTVTSSDDSTQCHLSLLCSKVRDDKSYLSVVFCSDVERLKQVCNPSIRRRILEDIRSHDTDIATVYDIYNNQCKVVCNLSDMLEEFKQTVGSDHRTSFLRLIHAISELELLGLLRTSDRNPTLIHRISFETGY